MLAVDVHQHLWPLEVLRALERRSIAPCATWTAAGWRVELAGEPAFLVDPADHDVAARVAAVRAGSLDRALVALSTPAGIEELPAAEARPLLDAWSAAAAGLPPELGWWASVALADGPAAIVAAADGALDAGAVGVVVAGGALACPAGLDRLAPLLDRLEERLAPLFVHPGPTVPAVAVDATWWAPSTAYVAELHTAWHAWAAWGRERHPGLHLVWAALAGLAPLHAERTELRGGPPRGEPDPLTFYDTSGYGPRALRWMACAVGTSQLVHGTDAPVVVPPSDDVLGADAQAAVRGDNVARLLGTAWVAV